MGKVGGRTGLQTRGRPRNTDAPHVGSHRAAGAHSLATGFGDTGSVGIGGITLSGGIGFLVRKHGLSIDDRLAADVVTADGELVRATPSSAQTCSTASAH